MQKQIANLQAQIAKTKQKQSDNQTEREGLLQQRASLVVADKSTKEIDKQIAELRTAIDGTPAVLALYTKQLAEAKQKLAADNRDQLLNEQKQAAATALKLSKELVQLLAKAVGVNSELHAAYKRYQQLYDLTKVDLLGSHFAEPSNGLLEYLYGFLKAELEEGTHCRVQQVERPQI